MGTGVLGGFTTFSSLAVEMERLLAAGDVTTGLVYGAASVVLGLVACLLGVALAARHRGGRGCRGTRMPHESRSSPCSGDSVRPRGSSSTV